MLMTTDHIHVSFHNNGHILVANAVARQMKTIQIATFVKQWCVRRIEIFLRTGILINNPSAESNDFPFFIADGKHEPIAKTVNILAFPSAGTNQSQVQHFLSSHAAFFQILIQIIPARRRSAQLKFLNNLLINLPFLQILSVRPACLGLQQNLLIISGGKIIYF